MVSKITELKQEGITAKESSNEKNVKLLENDIHEIHTGQSELKNQIDNLSATLKNISELTKPLQIEAGELRQRSNQPQYSISAGGAILKIDLDDLQFKLYKTEDRN